MHLPAIREFRLSPHGDASGAFVGGVPLLERTDKDGNSVWRSRDIGTLSTELGKLFGVPVDLSSKSNALASIADALNKREIARAQLITLHMEIPDPPSPADVSGLSRDHVRKIATALAAGRLLKADWNPDEHPRWPAGAPDSQGGQFAPKEEGATDISQSDDGASETTSFPTHSIENFQSSSDDNASPISDWRAEHDAIAAKSYGELFNPVIYRGVYHDQVVQHLAEFLRNKGLKVETEVYLQMADGSGGTRIDILAKGELTFGIEVKTGDNPSFTPGKLYVDPHLIMGGSVISSNPRVISLGLLPGKLLPPIPIILAYIRDPYAEPIFRPLDAKKLLQEFYRRFGNIRAKKMAHAVLVE